MYFFQLIHYNTLVCWFYVFGFCTAQTMRALVITRGVFGYRLTRPIKYDPVKMEATFNIPKEIPTHFFCQSENEDDKIPYPFLRVKKSFTPDTSSEVTDTNHCDLQATTYFVKVTNPGELKNNDWDWQGTEMELYHSGYLLEMANLELIYPGSQYRSPAIPPKYEREVWTSSYFKFLVQIEAYFNKKTQRIMAVEYNLLHTKLPYRDQDFSKYDIVEKAKTSLRVLGILTHTDEHKYLNVFQDKISEEWMTKLKDELPENDLTTTMFAPNIHFSIPLWEQHSLQAFNLFPMWEKPKKMWTRVQKFARIVAMNFGDLKVTTGFTGVMTLSNEEIPEIEGFQFPKYVWSVFQSSGSYGGIIIVLNYNPFEKTEAKLCETNIDCDTVGWRIGNSDFRTGEIQCCEMTKRNIENLNANFSPLEKKYIFNLHKWKIRYEQVQSEYQVDVLDKESNTVNE